jgi:membrane protein YqaA with SNARE-associated domain
MRTLEELNQKPWYRFFKVVYVIMWLPYPLILYVLTTVDGAIKACLIMTLVYVLFAEGIRRAFYYVLLGQLFPKAKKPQAKI